MTFHDLLISLKLNKGSHVIVHSSFSKIKNTFNEVTHQNVITDLKKIITPTGSLIMPAFTYCWKKKDGTHSKFDRSNSPSLVGYLSEEFRKSEGVIRTNSPTHSFSVWGEAAKYFDENNSPESPLGKNSILEWLTKTPNSFILMLGTNFRACTYATI
jgi:aminoglycoside 3-N-acetyltransferase